MPLFFIHEVRDIYWGDLGVSFGWKLASVPKVKTVQAFGPEDAAAPTDLLLAEALESAAASDSAARNAGPFDPMASSPCLKSL